jgi:hypothetical protein
VLHALLKIWREAADALLRLTGAARRKAKVASKEIMLPSVVSSSARKDYLAAVLIAKNEASYLIEWLEFHQLAGFEHVYVYDNGSVDSTAVILGPYIRSGFVSYLPWANFDQNAIPQRQAYAHAICNFGPRWRWMAFIDVDEFLFPLRDDCLRAALRAYEDLPAVALHWHMFGSSGHKRRPPGLVIENYTQRAAIPSPAGSELLLKWKSIVDPSKIRGVVSPHVFLLDDGRKGAYDEERRWILKTEYAARASTILRLNHYYTKSEEELAAKIAKGSVGRLSVQGVNPKSFAALRAEACEMATVKDEAILRFVPALRKRLSAALAGSVV